MSIQRGEDGYLPIEGYGAIGNLRTVALVGIDGAIDWCCFPELGRPSVFAALLDSRRGGTFRVAPVRPRGSGQRYRERTCILETHWEAEGGRLTVTDFMPLHGSIIGAKDPRTAPEIYRILRCEEGEVEVEVEWAPRFDYARADTRMERRGRAIVAYTGHQRLGITGVPVEGEITEREGGPVLRARFSLSAGEERIVVTRYTAPEIPHADTDVEEWPNTKHVHELLEETCEVWQKWEADNEQRPTSDWAGDWTHLVTRSELTLKLLTHPDTGAIAAAATTSLPEDPGGVRNWDYRFSWVRDAIFVVQALHALGHSAEAYDFLNFIERCARGQEQQNRGIQIMYGLHGETELPEVELHHLEGYRGARPVRLGNGAAKQAQHDTYGELLNGAYALLERGEQLKPDDWEFLSHIADRACTAWRAPDHGIWEMRGSPRHFVYSKAMVWRALDRAVRMAERWGMPGDVDGWRRSSEVVREVVIRRGYDEEIGAFTQSFGSRALDAANLLLSVQGLLDADDPRILGTIDRTLERLTENGLVYRYRTDDGLPGDEGAFGVCTFWLVDALCLAGRQEEALEIFEGMCSRASPLGLFSEQIDPETGAFLGNFPQAFTHLGLVNSAMYLAEAMGRPVPERALLRQHRHRIRETVPHDEQPTK